HHMNIITCYTHNGDIVNDLKKIQILDFSYIQITLEGKHAKSTINGNIMVVSATDYAYATEYKWYLNSSGYPATYGTYDGIIKFGRPVPFHQLVMGKQAPGMVIDHINRNRLDNRRSNLRVCTAIQNSYNRSKNIKSNTKYKGVIKSG